METKRPARADLPPQTERALIDCPPEDFTLPTFDHDSLCPLEDFTHHTFDDDMLEETPTIVLDTRLPYRVGSPMLPVQPLDTFFNEMFAEWRDPKFRQDFHRILSEENVHVKNYHVVKRVQKGKDVQVTPRTIMVVSDISMTGQYHNWETAAARIRMLLESVNRHDILVEIIDIKAVWGVTSTPIENLDTSDAWKTVSVALLGVIFDRKWLSIDVINRELGEETAKTAPTICITAQDAEDEVWWDKILPQLRILLPSVFDVDIFYGNRFFDAVGEEEPIQSSSTTNSAVSGEDKNAGEEENNAGEEEDNAGEEENNAGEEEIEDAPEIFSTMESYSDVIQMGASIGVETKDTSGTVSACVELCTPEGETIQCALTNHHVIAQDDTIGQHISPNDAIARKEMVRVVSPSNADHGRLRKWMEIRVKRLQAVEKKHRDNGRTYDWIDTSLASACKDANALGHGPGPNRYLGSLWASSGYRTSPYAKYSDAQARTWSQVTNAQKDNEKNQDCGLETSLTELIGGRTVDWGLNWALIKLQPPRSLSLEIPAFGARLNIYPGTWATEYSDIRPDKCYNVAKIGRTTRWTTGKINKIASFLNLRDDDVSVVPVDLRKRFENIVLAYGIVSNKQEDFIAGGDSGSVVLLNEAEATILGLAFASNQATFVSYMMPMGLVIEDIEKVTGCKVTTPRWAGEASGGI